MGLYLTEQTNNCMQRLEIEEWLVFFVFKKIDSLVGSIYCSTFLHVKSYVSTGLGGLIIIYLLQLT